MSISKKINNFLSGTPSFLIGVFALLAIFNINTISGFLFPGKDIVVGSVAAETLRSPRTIYYKSQIKTNEAQERAAAKIEKVYVFDSTAQIQQESKNKEIFTRIDTLKKEDGKTEEIKNNTGISDELASAIESLGAKEWSSIKEQVSRVTLEIQNKEEVRDDEEFSLDVIDKYLSDSINQADRFIISGLVSKLLIGNYYYSQEETSQKIENAKQEVEPVSLLVVKDEVIVSAGDTIDDLDLERLEAVGLSSIDLWDIKTIGSIIFSLLLVFILFIYFRYFYKSKESIKVSRVKAFYVAITFIIISVLAYEFLTPVKPIIAYLFPVAAPVILISILLGIEVAFFITIVLSLFLGAVLSGSIELFSIFLFSSLIGIYKTRDIKRIVDIFKIGFWLLFFNFATAIAFHLMAGSFSLKTISVLLGASSVYGLGSVVIVIGSLMFWGNIFGITTLLDLLELENPHQKLLRDLSLKAPGTYHHSILVSNIAERAAKNIGANVLLCGVGSLYHDIGKIKNPSYFIENQKRKNIHDSLKDPEKSAQFIKEHVSEGVFLAKKHKLPKEIINYIESHHGTSEVFYFLEQAKKINSRVDLEKFKYPGPLPASKEAAIIMLADVVEARSRAETKSLNRKKITEIVSGIVTEKMEEGQLKDSSLALDEIEKIKQSFIDVLENMYHKRIKYDKKRIA